MESKPKTAWKSALEVFRDALKHEQHITACIENLGVLADELNDRATGSFLKWFYDEQVEEEKNTMEITDQLSKIGDSVNGQYMLDHRLGKRE